MKKIAIVLCLVLALSACKEENKQQAQEKPVIKIGVTMPLTGDAAEAGQAAKAALEMVLEDLKQNKLKYNYELIFEDNQMNAGKTANNVNKLMYADKVDAIFSMWNLMSNVVSSITSKYDMFSFACSYGRLANTGDYSFNMQNTFEDQASLFVKELKKRGIHKIALFVDNSTIMEQYNVVESYLKNNSNIEVVFKEYFNPGEKDYRMAIAKAAAQEPDLYVISGYPPSPYLFLKQIQEITGSHNNVTAIDALAEINADLREIADGLWYIDSNQNGLDMFQKELFEKKHIQSQSCVGNVASNLQIFINAVENADVNTGQEKPSKENIRRWIFEHIKNYPTQSGPATVIEDGFIAVPPSIKMIQDGRSVLVKE